MSTKLSVNINKIATLRNARGHQVPDVVQWAIDIESFGANGITVHPRPDERHITRADVYALKKVITTEFNVEGYPSDDFLQLVKDVLPHQVTLVPDPPEAITSNAGWDVRQHENFLTEVVGLLKSKGMRTSLFVDAENIDLQIVKKIGADRIELFTEPYAKGYLKDKQKAIDAFNITAQKAFEAGLGVNAGHDLSLENLSFFAQQVPHLLEVSIGHALISDALRYGMENTVRLYQRCLNIEK
jgi:pyridoxine 5-phosphate synthase